MNTVSSSSNYSVSASTNKGFSGMVSGMDTEDLVQKMLSGTQTKIDRQSGKKQVTQWKQNMYRDIISNVNKFQTKFLDFTSNTNLMSNSFFSQMKATSTSSAFRISGNSDAIAGNTSVSVERLATTTRIEGTSIDSSSQVDGAFNVDALKTDAFESRVSFDVADANGTIANPPETITLDQVQIDKLMKGENVPIALKDPNYKVTFSVKDGNLTITSTARAVTVKGATGMADKTGTTALGLEMLGLKAGTKTSTEDGTITSKINKDALPKLDISLDGIKKTIEIKNDITINSLQDSLDFAFGKGTVTVKGTDLSKFSLTTSGGRKIVVGGSGAVLEALGLKEGQSNSVAMGDTLENVLKGIFDINKKASFSINDKKIYVTNEDTIGSFMNKINTSDADVRIEYSELEKRFVMSRKSSGAGFDLKIEDIDGVLKKAFGAQDTSTIGDVLNPANGMYKRGQNALVTINGTTTERSSNSFTINGLNYELLNSTEVVGKDAGGKDIHKVETVSTTRNTDTIFDGIKSFVNDYNSMIKDLNDLVGEKEEYKDYPPLSEAQRKEMSKSEIDAWEKKAKIGLLKGDSDVSSFLSQMRLALYEKPTGAKYALYDIGIGTSKDWKERGKLEINEDQLKKMINSDPTAVQELFTYSKTSVDKDGITVPDGAQGIATAFKNIIKATANTSSGSPGILVKLAGVDGMATEKNNMLGRDMDKMNDKIKSLKVQYEREKSKYWAQFNNMEKVLANLSSQSGWLTQQFG